MAESESQAIHSLDIPDRYRSRRSPRWLWPALGLVALVLGLTVLRKPLAKVYANLRAPKLAVAELQLVSAAALMAEEGTSSNGYVVAGRRAALSADTPGRIVELNVTEGTRLKQGDVVARLFYDELDAQLASAQAQVESAKAGVVQAQAQLAASEAELPSLDKDELATEALIQAAQARQTLAQLEIERIAPLVKDLVLPTRDGDRATADLDGARADLAVAQARRAASAANRLAAAARVEVARSGVRLAEAAVQTALANLDGAKARLSNTYVRAPFDGIVVLKDAEVGEVVSPNVVGGSTSRGSVATMVDLESLEVQAEVPETSLAAVEVGRPARLFLDAFPDSPYDGRVDRIWPTANREKATVEVRVKFLAPDDRLRPEMGVRVVFLSPGKELEPAAEASKKGAKLMIPEAALVERDGRQGAFLLEDGRARFVPLELGEEQAGRREVLGGLEAGAKVLLEAPQDLADGARVSVKAG